MPLLKYVAKSAFVTAFLAPRSDKDFLYVHSLPSLRTNSLVPKKGRERLKGGRESGLL